jgi:hypothetical protein
MRIGSPFKMRWTGRPSPGMLSTPDVLKFHIPVPFAFVPTNKKFEAKQQHEERYKHNLTEQRTEKFESEQFISNYSYMNSRECQQSVNNFNKCLKNNDIQDCQFYLNYLNSLCQRQVNK